MQVFVKVRCEQTDELRRCAVDVPLDDETKWPQLSVLLSAVQQLFAPGSRAGLLTSVRYQDSDADWITVSTDRELAYALSSLPPSSPSSPVRLAVCLPSSLAPGSAAAERPPPLPTDYDAMLDRVLSQIGAIVESPSAPRLLPTAAATAHNSGDLLQGILTTPIVQQQILPLVLSGLFPQLAAAQQQQRTDQVSASSSSPVVADAPPPPVPIDERLSARCVSTSFDPGAGTLVWRLLNVGSASWPKGTRFVCTNQQGSGLFALDSVPVPEVKPGKMYDVNMQLRHSDHIAESATATFQLLAPAGAGFFGEPATAVIGRDIAVCLREEQSLLRQLQDMGFSDREMNLRLVRKHKFDLSKIISDLVELS